MAQFLSAEWLSELADALRETGPLASETRLLLGQVVTGTPAGEVAYTLLIGGGEPSEVRAGTNDAAVTLVEDYASAVALATGTPAAELLSTGSVKVRGDAGALLRAQELLATVGPALAGVAASTEY
jgi:ubiquinone biosynthesis protein UbiJ